MQQKKFEESVRVDRPKVALYTPDFLLQDLVPETRLELALAE
jgi:hypothetical protein